MGHDTVHNYGTLAVHANGTLLVYKYHREHTDRTGTYDDLTYIAFFLFFVGNLFVMHIVTLPMQVVMLLFLCVIFLIPSSSSVCPTKKFILLLSNSSSGCPIAVKNCMFIFLVLRAHYCTKF